MNRIRIPVDDEGAESYGDRLEREAAEQFLFGQMAPLTVEALDARRAEVDRMAAELDEATAAATVPDEDPLVTTSMRLRRSTLQNLQAYADARDVKPGALMRQWIEAAFAEARGVPVDPVAELRKATEHVAQFIQQQRAA